MTVSMQKEENRAYPVRPHHGMCLAFFYEEGYNPAFTAHMREMLDVFLNDAKIVLTVRPDMICTVCPHRADVQFCDSEDRVAAYDRAVLAACGLQEGDCLPFSVFVRLVEERILGCGGRSRICGDCSWHALCERMPDRWRRF